MSPESGDLGNTGPQNLGTWVTQVPKICVTQLPKYPDSVIPNFPGPQVPRSKSPKLPGYLGLG